MIGLSFMNDMHLLRNYRWDFERWRRRISGRCKYVPIFLEGMGERSKRSQRSAIYQLIDPKVSSEAANPL